MKMLRDPMRIIIITRSIFSIDEARTERDCYITGTRASPAPNYFHAGRLAYLVSGYTPTAKKVSSEIRLLGSTHLKINKMGAGAGTLSLQTPRGSNPANDDLLAEQLAAMMAIQPERDYDQILEKAKAKHRIQLEAKQREAQEEMRKKDFEKQKAAAQAAGMTFDWLSLLGERLLNKSGEIDTVSALQNKRKVCLYFGGEWCGPCKEFVPQLISAYNQGSASERVEVVFISSDKAQSNFDSYYMPMPWLAVPFSDRARKNALSSAYEVTGIPTLIVLDGLTGEMVTNDGRSIVQQLFEGPPTATQKPGYCNIKEVLDLHNSLRALHGAPPLAWSDKCADEALVAAEACKAKNTMFHNNCKEHNHGQNIFAYNDASGARKPDSAGVQEWYNECIKPGYPFGDVKEAPPGTGHFTQVVWRGTTHVGMAFAGTPETNMFVVANYSPPGNWAGDYRRNVLKKGEAPPPDNLSGKLTKSALEIAAYVSEMCAAGGTGDGVSGEGISVTVTGGPEAGNNPELLALLKKLPESIIKQAPQVISNIMDNLAKKDTIVTVTLGAASLKTSVKEGNAIRSSEMKWG